MMLDEEVYEDGLEVKSPQWQSVEVGNRATKLDERKWRIADSVCQKNVSYPMLGWRVNLQNLEDYWAINTLVKRARHMKKPHTCLFCKGERWVVVLQISAYIKYMI